jgi:flagellar biogenesis protein FliO
VAPTPGTTVNVNVPVPGEQQLTKTAINFGWLIALLIIVALFVKFGRFLWQSQQLRIVGAVLIAGALAIWLTRVGVF